METTLVGRQPRTGAPTGAGDLRLERRADGRVWAIQGTTERAVWVRRSFPWSEPGRFLSLRDDDEEEFALVGDPADLDAASRLVLESALVDAGFVFEVTRVLAIDEEVEIRHWRVETRQGRPPFQTPLHHPARLPPPRRLLGRGRAGA